MHSHHRTLLRCLVAALLLGCASGSAQEQTTAPDTDAYSRLSVSLVGMQPVYTGYHATSLSTHSLYGLGVGYVLGINVTGHSLPLFLEVGPELVFARRTDDIDIWDGDQLISAYTLSTQMLTLSTPIDLAYHLRLTDGLVLAPAAGLTAKAHLLASTTEDGVSVNLFNTDAHRFQLGCNVACGLYLGRFYVGLSYAADLTSFQSAGPMEESYRCLDLTAGLRF